MAPILATRGAGSALGFGRLFSAGSYFESIATANGTGSSGIIEFTSIPQTYKHLQIRFSGRCNIADTYNNGVYCYFNGDSSTNYAYHYVLESGGTMYGAGTPNTGEFFIGGIAGPQTTSNISGVGVADILDYTHTNKFKTVRTFYGQGAVLSSQTHSGIWSGLWRSTSAITSMKFYIGSPGLYSFSTSTTFSLYGIKGI